MVLVVVYRSDSCGCHSIKWTLRSMESVVVVIDRMDVVVVIAVVAITHLLPLSCCNSMSQLDTDTAVLVVVVAVGSNNWKSYYYCYYYD